jgi:hypothetical protein
VALQVVDRHEREPTRPRDRLRRGDADEERADETRPLRHRHALHTFERRFRPLERLTHDRRDELEMPPRRDLGNDAAVALVQPRLRGHDRCEHLPVVDDCSGRLVARCLDPEDHEDASEAVLSPSGRWPSSEGARSTASRHMINASSRLSV